MSLLRALAASLLPLASGCEPAMEPDVPTEEEIPCHRQSDCEMHQGESATRRALCGSDVVNMGLGGRNSPKQSAACGQFPTMNANLPEPELACFRGKCVPIGSRR